ncbi:MAG TPA: ribonuclease H-like domain-containing protein, partial [Dehalococcoidia bacterium]|nr:ribonuclease H-like domain-containing protein [Dehalococcoidia bacterium]
DRVRAALGTPERRTAARHPPALPPLDAILGASWVDTADGPALVRDEWYPADHTHGRFPISGALERPGALAELAGGPAPRRPAFLDIETTGLAGGSGTYAFLIGVGAWREEGFRVRQYLLPGPGLERPMLRLLAEDLAGCDALVTYNGRAFDAPLLESRFALNRLVSPLDGLRHLDLLYPVRRLYRFRCESRRLIEVEARLLDFSREDDVPGWLMPQLYFDYLRAGRVGPLRFAFRHNRWDVLAMGSLLTRLALAISGETDDARERLGVAGWRERRGEPERAVREYAAAIPDLRGPERTHALWRLSLLYRRQRRWQDAVALWRELVEEGDVRALVELAKHFEHRERDLERALAACERAARLGHSPELLHRISRLQRKLGRETAPERREA